jgi:hypothetical protein
MIELSRLECREVLAHLNKVNVDPDVLAKLSLGANTTSINTPQHFGLPMHSPGLHLASTTADGVPPFIPVVYTPEQLARIAVPEGGGTRPATQADVDEVNRVKLEAHNREWRTRLGYKANLNERDVVNAAFDAPERERGFDPNFERVAVGQKNRYGDECVDIGADGESIFRCTQGHGYKQSRSLRSCSACFIKGVANEQANDPGALAGSDSRW